MIYYLKLAQVHQRYGAKEQTQVFLARGYDMLKKHLGRFRGTQYFYGYFLTVALAKGLEGRAEAEENLAKFSKMRERSLPRLDPRMSTACTDFFQKAQQVLQ